ELRRLEVSLHHLPQPGLLALRLAPAHAAVRRAPQLAAVERPRDSRRAGFDQDAVELGFGLVGERSLHLLPAVGAVTIKTHRGLSEPGPVVRRHVDSRHPPGAETLARRLPTRAAVAAAEHAAA